MPEKTGFENKFVEYGNDTEIEEAVQHATEAISGMIEDPELAAAISNHRAEAGTRWNPGDAEQLSFAFDYATIDMTEEQRMAVAEDIAATLHQPMEHTLQRLASEYPHASASGRDITESETYDLLVRDAAILTNATTAELRRMMAERTIMTLMEQYPEGLASTLTDASNFQDDMTQHIMQLTPPQELKQMMQDPTLDDAVRTAAERYEANWQRRTDAMVDHLVASIDADGQWPPSDVIYYITQGDGSAALQQYMENMNLHERNAIAQQLANRALQHSGVTVEDTSQEILFARDAIANTIIWAADDRLAT